jgi:plastocyanin
MRRVGAIVALTACLALVAAGCGDDEPGARPEPPPADLRGRSAVEVAAEDNLFTPPHIIIDAGTEVTWRNVGAVAHNVKKTADVVDFGGGKPFGVEAGAFGPGATYAFTFTEPGQFFYTCTIHTLMNGRVQVNPKPGTSTSSTGAPTSTT